ncbi:MAG: glycosyltransferase family 9 protein [Candidatus Omnitrophica bacterium]|nr:glycosyltransferase family 9 protein [Candidatus Omnitrophota bacterium]
MKIDKNRVNRILVINLSNIGDAVLTTPVIQTLKSNFPQAHLAVLVGPRAFSVFKNDRRIDKKIVYDKAISWKNKLGLIDRLRHDRYDLVVDLRQTAFTVFLGTRYHTSAFTRAPRSLTHMKDRHLWKVKSLGLVVDDGIGPSVEFSEDEKTKVMQMFNKWQINPALPKSKLGIKDVGEGNNKRKGGVKSGQPIIALAPGARNMTNRWGTKGYKQLIGRLVKEYNAKIIMVGDEQDELLVQEVIEEVKPAPVNICGKTSIGTLTCLLTKCNLLVSNDSAPMHLAWAVNTPVVAIFGPTDWRKYAPGGTDDVVVHKDLTCAPCEKSLCPKGTRECMKLISVDEVFAACKKILDGPRPS